VVETSIGADRLFLAMLSLALTEDEAPNDEGKMESRTVLKLHPALAPVKCAVLPLVKNKPELTAKAEKLYQSLFLSFNCDYDEKDSIGRRYRRQDAVGTPFCVTVDFQTLEDDTVTIRERDSLGQERVHLSEVERIVLQRVDMKRLLEQLV
jgi:glycyl-tRNA synthetase